MHVLAIIEAYKEERNLVVDAFPENYYPGPLPWLSLGSIGRYMLMMGLCHPFVTTYPHFAPFSKDMLREVGHNAIWVGIRTWPRCGQPRLV